jgi:hypothetical protein
LIFQNLVTVISSLAEETAIKEEPMTPMSTSSKGEGVSTSTDVKPPIPEPIQSAAGGDKKKKCCKLHVIWLYPVQRVRDFQSWYVLEISRELLADAC